MSNFNSLSHVNFISLFHEYNSAYLNHNVTRAAVSLGKRQQKYRAYAKTRAYNQLFKIDRSEITF